MGKQKNPTKKNTKGHIYKVHFNQNYKVLNKKKRKKHLKKWIFINLRGFEQGK